MSGDLHEAAGALIAELRRPGADLAAELVARDDDAARLALAAVLWGAGRHGDAVALYRRLAAAHPADARLAYALGRALTQTGALAEGEALLRAIATQLPHYAEAQAWWGIALMAQRRQEEAVAPLAAALALRPGEREWHMAHAETLLALGRWDEGWAEHAWRWQGVGGGQRAPARPLERPDPASWAGRTVLLHAEQGHGDTIQCLRYVAPAQAAGARVVLEVQPALLRLAAAMPGVVAIAAGDPVPDHAIAVPMFNLPWAFGSIPAAPYLAADPAAVARWRARLAGLPGRRVGLVWAGDPRAHNRAALAGDQRRSIPLAALAPLGRPGVSLVSLQKGAAATQPVPPGMVLHDWTEELTDFAATAALTAALDLVISVDTAPVHLAGALGRPVWLLNRFDTCWRWGLRGDASLWYPSLRQFRQDAPGDWAPVVARAAAALGVA